MADQIKTELTADDRKLNSTLKRSGDTWRKYGKGIAAVAAVASAAFVAATKKSASFSSNVAKSARALNVDKTTFQNLQSLESQSGLGTKSAALAINEFQRFKRFGFHKSGFGGAFREIGQGISMKDFQGTPMENLLTGSRYLSTVKDEDKREMLARNMYGGGFEAALHLARMSPAELNNIKDIANAQSMAASQQAITANEMVANQFNALLRKANPAEFIGENVSPTAAKMLEAINKYFGEESPYDKVMKQLNKWLP